MLLLVSSLLLSGCGLAFSKRQFLTATSEGTLQRGQSAAEIRKLLGSPDRTQVGMVDQQPFEVWMYHQTTDADKMDQIGRTFVTLGLLGMIPVGASEPHFLVLRNDQVVAWDVLPEWLSPRFVQSLPQEQQNHPTGPSSHATSEGTGFLVDSTHVVTNHHVIAGKPRIAVAVNGTQVFASILVEDAANDLAILRLAKPATPRTPDGNGSTLTVGDTAGIRPGDHVWTLGFPLSLGGQHPVLTEGTINSLVGMEGDPRFFQFSAQVQPGNSGGPLFNQQGEVIGVVTKMLNAATYLRAKGIVPQNVNFALKIDYLRSLLNSVPSNEQIVLQPSARSTHTNSLSTLAERMAPEVVHISAAPAGLFPTGTHSPGRPDIP